MPRPLTKIVVGGHVTYWSSVTRKPRPGTITAVAGGGSTTLAAQATAGATSLSTVATAAVGQFVVLLDADPAKIEERRVSAVSGAGPFTLTVPAIQFTHLNGASVKLQPTSITLRVSHTAPIASIARRINKSDLNVWSIT